MEFDFDEKKSSINKDKHGIDFFEAQRLWQDVRRIEVQARSDKELRFALIAKIADKLWTAIFTLREDKIRIISVRRSRKNEEEKYNQC